MTVNSPYTGKPMRVVYEPETWLFRGEKYHYTHIAFRDDESKEQFTTTESDTVCFLQVTNQYRAKYGIPYTDEIVSLRDRYGLSAAKMSSILGFGINQYRLYETGEVPSESNGKMILGAMNPRVFLDLVQHSREHLTEREIEKVSARIKDFISKDDMWKNEQWTANLLFNCRRGPENGFAPQSAERLRNLLLYILEQMGEVFQTKMNKVLFYIDFLSYRECGMAISGLAYDAIDFGPVPQRWDRVYSAFDGILPVYKLIYGQESVALKADSASDMKYFSEPERLVIDSVCAKMKDLSAHDISELSHLEPAWKNNLNKANTIPYSDAFTLVAL